MFVPFRDRPMRINSLAGSTVGRLARSVAADSPEPDVAESRALIAIEAPAPAERSFTHSRHPAAPFLAHLIATHMRAPQTCARRRVEPGEAISVYAAMAARRG
jgi:hypothetical protein